MSIPSDIGAAGHATIGGQKRGGSGLVDSNVSSGERRRKGGTSAGVLRIVNLLRSPIMETVSELKEGRERCRERGSCCCAVFGTGSSVTGGAGGCPRG